MVDTERFHLGPELVHRVTTLAARIAIDRDRRVSPLQVVAYLPIDVESVGRILESVADDPGLHRGDAEGICYFEFDEPTERVSRDLDIANGEHLEDRESLEENLASLKSDGDWSRKVREQHELLRVAARADRRSLELSYFLDHSDVPSARVQSILNDFGAEGYVHHEFGEEETLEYLFPELDYTDARFETNIEILDELEESEPSRPIWGLLGAFALVLLIVVFVIRFYAG